MIRVAAAAIIKDDQVLLARRPLHVHQGGLWEFPGGKVESGESVEQALCRELKEELDIEPTVFRPLIRIPHHYPDKSVLLDVWQVEEFLGEPHGREGQPLQWVLRSQLGAYQFPAANLPILNALQLEPLFWITPALERDSLLVHLDHALAAGARQVLLRAPDLGKEDYREVAVEAQRRCQLQAAALVLHQYIDLVKEVGAQGVHLTSAQMQSLNVRPVDSHLWLGASCHDAYELRQAGRLGCDYAFLSPVAATSSHPAVTPMGWERFQSMIDEVALPVYALGGMCFDDLDVAWRHGAQGIAGISRLFQSSD